MAHALRYYKEIQQENGQIIRLEIHRKDSTLPAVEIGRVLQALRLDIQGGADTIDAPIVKTSLTMTFVDAPDLEAGKKCGSWEEFYTPDSTMWKVVLKADGKTIWGGYVTPDSYQEDLRYRGSVTIIARDNIGHMQDFPFDMEGNADGMVTLQELVDEAWAKIESPMILDWRHKADDAMYLLCDGVEAPQTYMNVSAFEDMNFFDAVEKALYSYGLVMRYTGSNRVTISSLRDLPYQGKSSAPRAIEPTFLAHAQRELAAAARRIEESVKYDIEESVALPRIKENDFSGSRSTYRCAIEGVDLGYGKFGTLEHEAPIWPITDTPHWSNMPSTSLAFNPKIYPIGYFSEQQGLTEDIYQPMYLAANNVDQRLILFKHLITCATFNLRIKFTDPISLNSSNKIERCSTFNLKSIKYAIFIEQGKTTYYYGKDGSWRIDYQELTEEYDATQSSYDFVKTINMGEFSGSTEITFAIIKIEYAQTSSGLNKYGLYAGIQLLAFEQPETNAVLETNNVNTKYVDSNNVIIERDPEFGPAYDTVSLPQIIKNGIFVKSGNAYLPAKKWAWSGGTPQQMAVYNHLQLLCYHSKPNNVISGDIVNADFVDMEAIYEWGGANHLLVSGSYNCLNGRIESAVLREFKFYNEMWSDVAGAEVPETEQNNRTTAESGSGASKASTYSNETTVNIGGTGGGGTGGSSTLAGLLDVQVSSPSNGQALVYDSVSGMWMNKTIEKGNDITSQAIIAALGYTPFDSDAFTKANIKNALGIKDWALASSKPSYTWSEIGSRPTALSAFTNDLGLGSLAYKSSLVASDIPSLPWSKITSGKPTTLSGYGIADAYTITQIETRFNNTVIYSDYIDLTNNGAYRHIGYGYASIGWKTSGPAAVFGTALYNLRIQCAIGTTDTPYVYVSQMYNGEAKEWAELVTYEGAAGKDFEALRYKIGGTYVLHRSDNDTFLNYGNRTAGNLYLYGTNFHFLLNGSSTPLKILADGTVHVAEVPLRRSEGGALKAGAYDALQYFSDGKLIMHRNVGATGTYINYGGRTEGLTLYGSALSFNIGDTGAALILSANKDASFTANLTVVGNMNSKNYPQGGTLSQNPSSAFISTIFGTDAVNDGTYRQKVMRAGGSAYDRICRSYSPMLTIKTSDTHAYISIAYDAEAKSRCYIGAGIGDAVNWSGILFHDNMDLIPKDDGAFYLGYSDKRWRTLNAVNVSADGIYGYVPEGGTYQRYRLVSSGDTMYLQVGAQDGTAKTGKLTISGINVATLISLTIYSQQTLFSGAVQVNGTSRFVSLATFDAGLKIGDATLTWDASAGMLKIDKGVYSEGAITAKKKA